MSAPRFSVVIPARNRPESLPVTLRTVLAQDFDDYEIVVVDNASDVDLGAVVSAFADPRIRYHRQAEPLAMTDNWNDALGRAEGEWVLFLGDDDGLCRGALSTIDRLAREYPVRSMRWNWGKYTWPDLPDAGLADRLGVPLFGETELRSYREVVGGMVRELAPPDIPFVYHAAVERSLLAAAASTGPVFAGPIPDLHSGVLFSMIDEQFLHIGEPMTVMAWSGHSTTVAQFVEAASGAPGDFEELAQQGGHLVHPDLPDIVTIYYVHMWDPILRVRDRFTLTDPALHPDPKSVAQQVLDLMWSSGDERAAQFRIVEQYAARKGVPIEDLDFPEEPWPRPVLHPDGGKPSFADGVLTLDAHRHGVADVDGACALVAEVIDVQDGLGLVHDAIKAQVSSAVAEHGRAVQAHDSVLQRLADAQEEVSARDARIRDLEARIDWMRNSRSWRYTKWLRASYSRR